MPKSVKCVFIGYDNNYKGYRCLDMASGKVYISRNVSFDELTFPYQELRSPSQPGEASISSPLFLESLPLIQPRTAAPIHSTDHSPDEPAPSVSHHVASPACATNSDTHASDASPNESVASSEAQEPATPDQASTPVTSDHASYHALDQSDANLMPCTIPPLSQLLLLQIPLLLITSSKVSML